jgi:hypothetical protein
MSSIPYESQTQDWNTPEPAELATPGRPRRRFFNRKSAALAAAITCAAGFYAGVGVEKSQLASAATTTTASAPPAGATLQGSTAPGSGARAGFPGAARGGANASIGTVSSVNGKTVYLTDTTGNTVKVTLSSATKITKSESVSKASVRPGDHAQRTGSTAKPARSEHSIQFQISYSRALAFARSNSSLVSTPRSRSSASLLTSSAGPPEAAPRVNWRNASYRSWSCAWCSCIVWPRTIR